MLINLKRIVAYICPFCSNISSKALTVFNFSGRDNIKLICPTHNCHEVCVRISYKNSKYKFEIECPLCGEKHTYTISKENFWNKPLITHKCPATGIDIFFAGEQKYVEEILDENSEVYSDVVDNLFDDVEQTFSILYAIIERLHELMKKDLVSCVCGNDDVDLNIINDNIVITCKKCNKSKMIEANEETLIRLLNAHAVVIGNRK